MFIESTVRNRTHGRRSRNILFPVRLLLGPRIAFMAALREEVGGYVSAKSGHCLRFRPFTVMTALQLYGAITFSRGCRRSSKNFARDKLDSFLKSEFPVGELPREILFVRALRATQIHSARPDGTDSISSIMPTHAGLFPQDAAWLHHSEKY